MMPNHRQIATIILATAALCPATAIAQAAGSKMWMTDLLAASAARLTRTSATPDRATPQPLPFSTLFSPADRIDLAQVRSRSAHMAIGAAELSLSANCATNGPDRGRQALDTDHWSTRGIALSAAIPLASDVDLIAGGDYARVSRRLRIVDVNPHRLSTRMTRIGMALAFGNVSRLSLDYLSVARALRHDDLTRLAEAIGGAPLTGHGLELALATASSAMRRGMDWRFSLGAMQRSAADLGLVDQPMPLTNRRAMASLRFHL